jgi:hypothetical protein
MSKMPPIEWLNRHIPGFADLRPEERQAIEHFTLLWSLFEAECLGSEASNAKIERLVGQWADDGRFDEAPFAPAVAYFRERYFRLGKPTEHFEHLHLRRNDNRPLVEAVLKGDDNDPIAGATVALTVVYRFRNNLFHGRKWGYRLRGQLDNFMHANETLMSAMELHSRQQ